MSPERAGEKDQTPPTDMDQLSKVVTAPTYLPTRQAIVIVIGLYLTAFLLALDRFIIGVAIPRITDEFDSLGDVGWYGSAYMLTSSAFCLFMGRVYTFYNPKVVYLSCVAVFELGSLICGAAPNSMVFILGRAIAGAGTAGLVQGAIIIIVHIVPLHKRPQYTGFLGMVFGIASATSPLLGGAFTDGPGWRYCFYINPPLGVVVVIIHIFFLHIPKENLVRKETTFREKIARLDPIGTPFLISAVVCLLLALQWGGLTLNWSNSRIIVLLTMFGICLIIFGLLQRWEGDNASIAGRIICNRSIAAGASFSFFTGGAMAGMLYFLPIWFQAIKGASAVKSGLMMLPLVMSMMITAITAGILTKKIGYYAPWMILCTVIMSIGAGLITTWNPFTRHPEWIGYQVLFGLGLGLGQQQASVAAQTVLARKDVPTGASLMMFCQGMGGAIFLSVSNNLVDSELKRRLAELPGIDIRSVVSTGATDLRRQIPAGLLPQVLNAYNFALRHAFYVSTALACATCIGALTMEWKSVKEVKKEVKKQDNPDLNLDTKETDTEVSQDSV